MEGKKGVRAVNPLVATLVLTVLVFVAGLVVYFQFSNILGVFNTSGRVTVEDMHIVSDAVGNTLLTATVRNSGTKPIRDIAIDVNVARIEALKHGDLQPGKTMGLVKNVEGSFVAGNSYVVTLKVTYADGSASITASTVKCGFVTYLGAGSTEQPPNEPPEEPQNWLLGWNYRKSHYIKSQTGAGSGYPICLTVHYGEGADSGDDVYLMDLAKIDFSDVRITGEDGKTVLGYFVQHKVDSDYAVIWFNVTSNLDSDDALIYVYFGNPSASYVGSWNQVFQFYDDFKTQTVSNAVWTYQYEYQSVVNPFTQGYSSSVYHYDVYSHYLQVKPEAYAWATDYCQIRNVSTYPAGTYVVDIYQYDSVYSSQTGYVFKRVILGGEVVYSQDVASDQQPSGIERTLSMPKTLSAGPHDLTIQLYVSRGITNYPVQFWYEEVAVRRYVNPEPAHGVYGPLEEKDKEADWLDGWTYRRQVDIHGQSGTGSEYPISITLMYGSGTSNNTHIYLNSHAQTDFDDIRFTMDDRLTLIPYFIISKTDGNKASVWFAPQDSLDKDVTVYLYYGNPNAKSISSWKNVFELYDRFDSFSEDLWTYAETRSGFNHDQSSTVYYSADHSHRLFLPGATATFPGDFCRIYNTQTLQAQGYLLSLYIRDSQTSPSPSGYHQKRVYLGGELVYVDDVAGDEGWVKIAVTKTFNQPGSYTVELKLHETQGVTNYPVSIFFDDVCLRKYVSPEPFISKVHDEETS